MDTVDVIRALGNKYNVEILGKAGEPKSAQDLSDTLDVPIATCYRRIEELTDAGLLDLHDRELTDERRRINVYRREISQITISFEEDTFDVELEERAEIQNKLDDIWRTMSNA